MKFLMLFIGLISFSLSAQNKQQITLGAGCFWCVEAIFEEVEGVTNVESGYMGGHQKNPSYKEICTGLTGHAEVVKVDFDPTIISLKEILEIFWSVHDPTTLNRQGADVGTQYRSAIYYYNEKQSEIAHQLKRELNGAKVWKNPIVTEITPTATFYEAESYHQDFYLENAKSNSYCSYVITPKLEKFRKVFGENLK